MSELVPPTEPMPLAVSAEAVVLSRRLERERLARKSAEALLMNKSRELFDALQQARESEHRLQMALWASGEGIWEWSTQTERFEVHGLFIDGVEVAWPDVGGRAFIDLVHADDRDSMTLAWRLHLAGAREDVDMAYRIQLPPGERWVRVRGRALERDAQGRPVRVAGTIKDITAQRESEQSLHLLATAFASTNDALLVVDDEGRVVEANRAFCLLSGHASSQVRGELLSRYIGLPDTSAEGSGWRGEARLRSQRGEVPVAATVTFVAGQAGQSACRIVSMHDISERLEAENLLARQALHDSLTELPNRAAIQKHLEERLHQSSGDSFGLLFMDLDGFKSINDSFGHGAGDMVLQEVARRLTRALPEAFIGRWGGDEFVLVLAPGSGDFEVRQSAQILLATMASPFGVGYSQDMMMSPSIGAVLHPHDGIDAQTLLRKADAAMYTAKEQGKNCLRMYEPQIEEGAMRRVRLQSLLRIDAERSGFSFVVQPKVDARRQALGAELLVRWSTRDFGVVSPAEFIPMAEQTGAIELLGRQALHSAARLAAELGRRGRAMPVAVNLSPRQLLNPTFERIAMHACQRHGVPPSSLELELTESALAEPAVHPLLGRLRRHGFGLALDDFGTGYSSLSHLLKLPFQKVKIDRAFVAEALHNTKAAVVIRGTLDICKGLGLHTVAEGVETEEQFELLRSLGVDEFQGYLFDRPMPQDDWLAQLFTC
ncbi:MAG: EAL domain-containing protein [Burkholderiales bacterium]|nr:EAL domain-containing protein [Burkholderiales bacterium]